MANQPIFPNCFRKGKSLTLNLSHGSTLSGHFNICTPSGGIGSSKDTLTEIVVVNKQPRLICAYPKAVAYCLSCQKMLSSQVKCLKAAITIELELTYLLY